MDYPIEIDIEDNRAYTQIAFLVDRLDFLEDLKVLRDRFKIIVPFNFANVDSFQDHFAEVLGFDPKSIRDLQIQERFVTKSLVDLDDDNFDKKILQYRQANEAVNKQLRAKGKKVSQLETDFDNSVKEVRRKYRYPPMFDVVVKNSVLYGKVSGFETAKADFLELPSSTLEPISSLTPRDPYMVIEVTPYSTEKDIKQAFKRCCTDIRDIVERHYPVYQSISADTLTNIKRDRDWYWAKYNHKSYEDISNKWNESCPNPDLEPHHKKCKHCIFDNNKIEKAVSRYRKKLNVVIPKADT